MNCGIYEIAHIASGRRYIGSSKDIRQRFAAHRVGLRKGKHHSRHLQAAWNKYGEAAFAFRVLLVCPAELRIDYEQRLLDGLAPVFNAAKNADSRLGIGEETRKVMSAAQREWRRKYEWDGEQLCLSDIAARSGVDRDLLISRVLGAGFSPQEAVAKGGARPIGILYEHAGRSLSALEWAKEIGMHPRRAQLYLTEGRTVADCIDLVQRRTSKALSVRQFCALWGISDATVKSRLQSGDGLARALREPRKMDNAWRRA